MRIISFILLAFLSITSFSQTSLDTKNGFRHFRFGTSPSEYKHIVLEEENYSKNDEVQQYNYAGNDIQYVANVKTEDIELNFFKNKLFLVTINFADFSSKTDFSYLEYKKIFDWLEEAFGQEWLPPTNEDGVIVNGAIWDGEKIRIELLRIDFSKSKTDPMDSEFISGYLSIFNKKLQQQMYASEF